MKTQKVFSNGLIFILALIVMLSVSCAKELIEDSPQPRISPHEQMDENTETYTILTEGSIISAFDNTVLLRFPEGSFDNETSIRISRVSLNHLSCPDNMKLMSCGITISTRGTQPNPNKAFSIRLNYCPDELECNGSQNEKCLKIYGFDKCNEDMIMYYDCISQIGECLLNCNEQTMTASFPVFGTFISGKKIDN